MSETSGLVMVVRTGGVRGGNPAGETEIDGHPAGARDPLDAPRVACWYAVIVVLYFSIVHRATPLLTRISICYPVKPLYCSFVPSYTLVLYYMMTSVEAVTPGSVIKS